MESAGCLAASVRLRHPAASEAALDRQPEIEVAVALADFANRHVRVGAMREEQPPLAVAGGVERIVDVEGDRSSRVGPVFDESGPIRPAVVIDVELLGAEEREAVAV